MQVYKRNNCTTKWSQYQQDLIQVL